MHSPSDINTRIKKLCDFRIASHTACLFLRKIYFNAINERKTMQASDIEELSQQSRIDGRRLFGVSEFIYKLSIVANWIIGIIGGISSIGLILQGDYGILAGLLIAIVVTFICVLNYIFSVLTTHIAKVMVHTSLACVALVENNQNYKKRD